MTREEAIEILQNAIKKPNTKDGYLGQALDMAIKALEQDPCDDCVSRKAVLEMAKSYNTDGWDNYTPLVVDVEDIEELPQVTPQEPKIVPIAEIKFDEDKLKELVNNAVLTVTSQEPVIDKIRAEILEDCGYSKDYVGAFTYSTIKVETVLQILDKYKAERTDNAEV